MELKQLSVNWLIGCILQEKKVSSLFTHICRAYLVSYRASGWCRSAFRRVPSWGRRYYTLLYSTS